ncbi:MAG: AzlD domain-containing protein [Desulfovibrio sp.]|nr:AzlD domain-containing protein [Desulfovibrio sp.]
MTEATSFQQSSLLWCFLGCLVATVGPKILPITFLDSAALPVFVRRWLNFVPVTVMAALVGSEIFFYEGQFNCTSTNLYLLVSLPTALLAWWSKNYFLTIAFGLALIIGARALGFS